MKSNIEKRDWLLAYCVDEYGTLRMDSIDLSNFNGNVDFSHMKVKRNLYQHNQKVGGDINQSFQETKGNLYQDKQRVDGDIIQDNESKLANKICKYLNKKEELKNKKDKLKKMVLQDE